MVFVKVRETYDLHTTQNKMTVIGIHTPAPSIIKRNYPGLLMQCKMYRPYSCDVRVACASVMPLDPLGVGTAVGDVAPEDVFNPILYKPMSNFGMSQLEARINYLSQSNLTPTPLVDIEGESAHVDVDSLTAAVDDFPVYYGILSSAHDWKKANPQSGLEMNGLVPLVHEVAYNIGDNAAITGATPGNIPAPGEANASDPVSIGRRYVVSGAKRLPFLNCTYWTGNTETSHATEPGFYDSGEYKVLNAEQGVPYVNCLVGAIIVPPSRMHELFYRMVIEWTLEFTSIRTIGEITSWTGLSVIGSSQHYQNYDYSAAKAATVGSDVPDVLTKDSAMVSANVDINKVM